MGCAAQSKRRQGIRGWLRAVGVVSAVVLMASVGIAQVGIAQVGAAPVRVSAHGFEDLFVPSSMGPIKVQVQWAARGGSSAVYVLDGLRAPDDHSQWVSDTDVLRQFTGDDVTLVFPVGGRSSFYTDWYRPSSTNHQTTTYKWETFPTRELPEFLSRYGVSRSNNAIVGASMGGNAALVIAGHYRDQFRMAGSFSGMVHPTFPLWNEAMRAAMWDEGQFDVDDMWGPAGDPAWNRNDATNQAELLRGLPVYVSSGNGVPGPLDLPNGAVNTTNASGLEMMAGTAARMFGDRAAALGLDARVEVGNGTHCWPYWQRAIAAARPMVLDALGAR
ncbi:alpha/beta hydrolase [Nocardia vermiculata]|nr:alpha/beta hydrolase family protein [Nocardia vermiculata]